MRERVTILGATGSVGRSVADVVRQHPDRFAVEAVVGGSDAQRRVEDSPVVGAEHGARQHGGQEVENGRERDGQRRQTVAVESDGGPRARV